MMGKIGNTVIQEKKKKPRVMLREKAIYFPSFVRSLIPLTNIC